VKAVRAMIDTLQQRYDVRPRRPVTTEPEEKEKAAPEQAAFGWSNDR
jgi:hypothetical protein